MTNFEKYKDDILKLIGKGEMPAKRDDKIVACNDTPCAECDFFDKSYGCTLDFEWLNEDDGVPSLAQLQMADLQAEKTRLKNENEKLKEKIANLKIQNGKLEEKIEKQKETNNRLIEAQKEKYDAGYLDGFRAGKEMKGLEVGDIVKNRYNSQCEIVVTNIDEPNVSGINIKNGEAYLSFEKNLWEQTGRHIDIQEILKQIPRGEEDDNR